MTRVGTDMIEIGRIRQALERYASFRDRCFTESEQAYCESRPNPSALPTASFPAKRAA